MTPLFENEKTVEIKEPNKFRKTTPKEIIEDFHEYQQSEMNFWYPGPGEKSVKIPQNWESGAGKEFDVVILGGELLTRPLAGTEIDFVTFFQSLEQMGFKTYHGAVSSNQKEHLNPEIAAYIAGSNLVDDKGGPLLSMLRTSDKGVPVYVEYYAGEQGADIQTMSSVANINNPVKSDIDRYISGYARLLGRYAAKGSTGIKKAMGLSDEFIRDYTKIKLPDDVKASWVTDEFFLMFLQKEGLLPEKTVIESSGTCVTLQAVSEAIAYADEFDTPVIVRGGAPGRVLGDGNKLNYILTPYGLFLVGDVGNLTESLHGFTVFPQLVKTNDRRHISICMLRGALPVFNETRRLLGEKGKPEGMKLIMTAGRVHKIAKDNEKSQYGVGLSGILFAREAFSTLSS